MLNQLKEWCHPFSACIHSQMEHKMRNIYTLQSHWVPWQIIWKSTSLSEVWTPTFRYIFYLKTFSCKESPCSVNHLSDHLCVSLPLVSGRVHRAIWCELVCSSGFFPSTSKNKPSFTGIWFTQSGQNVCMFYKSAYGTMVVAWSKTCPGICPTLVQECLSAVTLRGHSLGEMHALEIKPWEKDGFHKRP